MTGKPSPQFFVIASLEVTQVNRRQFFKGAAVVGASIAWSDQANATPINDLHGVRQSGCSDVREYICPITRRSWVCPIIGTPGIEYFNALDVRPFGKVRLDGEDINCICDECDIVAGWARVYCDRVKAGNRPMWIRNAAAPSTLREIVYGTLTLH